MKVKVWSPEMHCDVEENAVDLEVRTDVPLRHEIERYAERLWSDSDYPDEMDFHVRLPMGELIKLVVDVSYEPTFATRYVE